jgi:tetratricopeptide (TPR) repeat protein
LLMGFYVQHESFEAVAQLYERANQFDQAGIAYEKAQKLTLARRAYERAKDFAAANRVRDVEVKRLVEKGDRLGAATLLMAVGRRTETVDLMKEIPPTKAYGFLKKLKLEDDAKALAETHLNEAVASKNELQRARWLEVIGKMNEALEIYLSMDRKDKASFVLESLGQTERAAQLAEEAGQLMRAEKLFRKGGDVTNADRVAKLPRSNEKAPSESAEGVSTSESDSAT